MPYINYSSYSSPFGFTVHSINVSSEFYDLWKDKKGHKRIDETSIQEIVGFANANGFTYDGNNIYKD